MNDEKGLVFGPVPSRRLGKSIGINTIPPKRCTYSCVYCQLGRTDQMQINRESFYKPNDIIQQVKTKITRTKGKHERIDYLTIVPDGEPTLDENLGILIKQLKQLSYPVAVITNSSLLYRNDVQSDLQKADWVSVKIDTINESIWKQIDRPYGKLNFNDILNGITHFSKSFTGSLCTETMMIDQINDDEENILHLARFIKSLQPSKSYLSIPTRPPAEKWVKPASERKLTKAYHLFTREQISTELLIGYEGNEFAYTDDAEQDILSITAVHPMREDAVESFLKKANENWSLIERLINEGKIVKHIMNNTSFYSRKFSES